MKRLSICFLLLASALLSSCASFEKKWDAAVADYQSGAVASPAGPWTGTWTTTTNGHTGDLRAIVEESKSNPGHYDFRYHATWAEILSGSFRVSFPVVKNGSTFRVDGDHKIGIFGKFRHEGTIRGNSFTASYSSDKGELGKFNLRRP